MASPPEPVAQMQQAPPSRWTFTMTLCRPIHGSPLRSCSDTRGYGTWTSSTSRSSLPNWKRYKNGSIDVNDDFIALLRKITGYESLKELKAHHNKLNCLFEDMERLGEFTKVCNK